MIDSKIHALEVLNYTLYGSKEREKAEIIRKSMVEIKRFSFKIDEEVFFKEICKREEGVKFMQANRISSLEELVMNLYEYRMKHEWMIYKTVRGEVDFYIDDAESEEYLD